MSLTDTFQDSVLLDTPFTSIPLEALGVEPEKFTITIPAGNCSVIQKEDGLNYERPYRYGIVVEFVDEKSRDTFFNAPNARDDAYTIQRTIEQGLQETMDFESDRDSGGTYGDQDDLVHSINESTLGDIKLVMPELEKILKSTFPDVGIKSIGVENIHGVDDNCPYVEGPFAGALTPPPQIKTTEAKLGL